MACLPEHILVVYIYIITMSSSASEASMVGQLGKSDDEVIAVASESERKLEGTLIDLVQLKDQLHEAVAENAEAGVSSNLRTTSTNDYEHMSII